MMHIAILLIVVVLCLPLSCGRPPQNGWQRSSAAVPPKPAVQLPAELIDRANGGARDDWYPAVVELGALARTDEPTRAAVWSRARVNSLGIKFAQVAPGTFVMGPSAMPGGKIAFWHPDQGHTVQHVEITKGLCISVTEVTNAQFMLVFPDHKSPPRSPLPESPATGVTWEQAAEFCRLLSERERARYRLPTEAEWEYACRAASSTAFCFGNDPNLLSEYSWYGRAHENAAPVGSLKPNAWGLYDMHGNALEWTADWYREDAYVCRDTAQTVIRDPQGPATGSRRVLRGGDWRCWEPSALTSSKRTTISRFPLYIELFDAKFPKSHEVTGFRVVRECDE